MGEDTFVCERCGCFRRFPKMVDPRETENPICPDCYDDEEKEDDTDDETQRQQADETHTDELLAVDFDGTLTQGESRYWAGEREQPNESMCEWVRQRYYEGAYIVVWTARPWSEANTIAARLTEWEVPYHGIRCEKGGADDYIDDKATAVHDVTNDS